MTARAPVCGLPVEERLRILVLEHFDAVYYALRRMRVPEAELEDCTQQVFEVAVKKVEAIQPGRERAFLIGVATNVAAHARRNQRRRREVPEDEAAFIILDTSPRPDELVEQRRLRALFDQVLAAMPEELRVVFVLFELEELSQTEIAAVLNIPTGTVASRIRRARETFTYLAKDLIGKRNGGMP